MLQTLCDAFAGMLRIPGDFLRDLVLLVPMPVARVLFLLIPAALAVLVLRQPRDQLAGQPFPGWRAISLRPWIFASLVTIILLYLLI